MKKPNLREQFEKETGSNWLNDHDRFNPQYVKWLETINSEMIDIGIRILNKLQSETESVTAVDQWDLEQALKKAGLEL